MEPEKKPNVLIVDDEPYNLRILERLLKEHGYNTIKAEDGAIAWDYLQKHPDSIDVILLDRMMPNMNGMEVIQKVKSVPSLAYIPIVMQTASSAVKEVTEGINAGVFYYLTKPFEEDVLISVVHSAYESFMHEKELRKKMQQNDIVIGTITMAQFKISSIREANNLTYFLAKYFPKPEKILPGLYALIINALEHGNLRIDPLKRDALKKAKGEWTKEISRLSNLPENKNKKVDIRYGLDEENNEIKIYIRDEGKGFDWKPYTEVNVNNVFKPSGRGITIAKKSSFDEVEFLGNGNEVLCTVKL